MCELCNLTGRPGFVQVMRGTSLGWNNCPKCNKDYVPVIEDCKCLICKKESAKVVQQHSTSPSSSFESVEKKSSF